jgi:ABC-type proline/glycine betaine transport system permease subunit
MAEGATASDRPGAFRPLAGFRIVEFGQLVMGPMIGVIVGEFIGAERGLGKLIIEAQARANFAEMMVAIFVMMIVGIVLSFVVRRVQPYRLRRQPQFEATA